MFAFFDLTSFLDSEVEISSVSTPNSQLNLDASQTLSFSETCGASGTSLSVRSNRAERSMARPPIKAVPEAARNRPTPQSALFKAVPEGVRNRALPPSEGTPLQQTATWLGPPSLDSMIS